MSAPWTWPVLGNPTSDADPATPAGLLQRKLFTIALPALGTVALPGPAAGFIRFYDSAYVVANAFGSNVPILNVFLGARQVMRTIATAVAQLNSLPQLGNGEQLDVVNTGATACSIAVTYYDVASTNLTLVRLQLTAALQTVIPAPVAGRRSSWVTWLRSVNGTVPGWSVAAPFFNEDTVAHTVSAVLAGVLIGRATSTAALTVGGLFAANNAPVTNAGALQWQLNEAVVTTPVFVFGTSATVITET